MTDSKVKVTSTPNPLTSPEMTGTSSILSGGVTTVSASPQVEIPKSTFPTNAVSLPSKGLLYDELSPLRQGMIEVKFMTAKEENILTTESYIKQGIVIDKFLQSMIISPKFNYDDLLIGDKDALIIASRIYGYGELYSVEVNAPSGKKQKVEINLEELESKEINEDLLVNGNKFNYQFTSRLGSYNLEFKLLTVGDQKKIDEKLKKYRKADSPDLQITTRLQQMILSVNGNEDSTYIKLFIENEFMARDSRAFREYVASIQPGVNMEIELIDEETGDSFRTDITIGPNFFWPDIRV